jgi:hypothetical protein
LAKGDVNGDGLDDFYVGGASGQSGQLYLADSPEYFTGAISQPWTSDAVKEDTGATFFDADRDGDLDLFVVSGGNEFPAGSELLDDRLYINDGKGKFNKAPEGSTIADHASGSCVTAADYDKDGDLDLFVGGRSLPGSFPVTTPGAILKNEAGNGDHKIKFAVATHEVNADLREPGMVTDAVWTDFNGDTWPDLIIVGEWMPVRVFENQKGKLVEVTNAVLEKTAGLWSRIVSCDFDGDGDTDYVLGNAGTNLPWKVSETQPLTMYYGDFNDDGRVDPVMCYSYQGKEYPVASRDEMLLQINSLRKKFTSYSQYAQVTVQDIFDTGALRASQKLKVNTFESSILENLGNGNFKISPLPVAAQVSGVNGIVTDDFNKDGFTDILLAGNFYPYRTQVGRSDSGMGLLLKGNGKGKWDPIPWDQSGFMATGDIRNMVSLNEKGDRKYILIARNNEKMSLINWSAHE